LTFFVFIINQVQEHLQVQWLLAVLSTGMVPYM